MLNLLGLSAQHLSPLLLVTPASLLGRTSAASSTWFHCGCSNSQSGPRAPHQEPGKHLKSTWNEWYGAILTGSKSLNSHSFFQTYVLINRPPSLFKGNSYTPALRPPPRSSKTKTNNTSLFPVLLRAGEPVEQPLVTSLNLPSSGPGPGNSCSSHMP